MIDFSGLPRSERRIVFYSEGESYWVHLEPIIKNFLEMSDVPVTYISSSGDDPGLKYRHERLRHFVTDDGWVRNWLFENIDTDVVVMTMPDLDSYQIKRSKNPVHYVYVQHSLVSLHMVYREHAFDCFDTLFCAGPHHVQEMKTIEAAHSLAPMNIIEHGYGRLDSIVAEARKRPPRQRQSDAPVHVLVAPSWGDSMIVESVGAELVATLLSQGFQVTLRPHPQTARFSRAKLDEIIRQHKSNPLFASEHSVAGQESLHQADVMISDWSGAALDFAFGLQKPVLFVDVPRKVNNQKYELLNIEPFEARIRDQVGLVLDRNEIAAAPSAVTELVSKPRFSAAKLNEIREANVFNVGTSGQVGALEVVKLLGGPL
jgi:CDP-glycerol glycerophosphotransferase (TagB/SpsB family)